VVSCTFDFFRINLGKNKTLLPNSFFDKKKFERRSKQKLYQYLVRKRKITDLTFFKMIAPIFF
jgi:hypothetical protein